MTGAVFSLPDQTVVSRAINITASQVAVATSETTTSTSYADLSTTGPAVTLTPGVTQKHMLTIGCELTNSSTADSLMSVAIAGATALTANCIRTVPPANGNKIAASRTVLATAQANGATHTAKYAVGTGTGTFANRDTLGIAL